MNSTSSENDVFCDVTLEGITSGTSNTAIGDDARRFLVDGSGNVCVGDEAGTELGARVSNCFAGQLKAQAAQIQKVSSQIEMSKPAAKMVANKP